MSLSTHSGLFTKTLQYNKRKQNNRLEKSYSTLTNPLDIYYIREILLYTVSEANIQFYIRKNMF